MQLLQQVRGPQAKFHRIDQFLATRLRTRRVMQRKCLTLHLPASPAHAALRSAMSSWRTKRALHNKNLGVLAHVRSQGG
jgi:hypothetical protein